MRECAGPSLELSCRLEAGGCAVRASPGGLGSLVVSSKVDKRVSNESISKLPLIPASNPQSRFVS